LPDFSVKKTEWLWTEFATVEFILTHYLGRKPSEDDYEKVSIISLDDDEINYYIKYGEEILGGLIREIHGEEYTLKFKKNK